MAKEPILIVLVEDDDGHAELVERNLKCAGVANGIHRLKDGQEAIDFVHAQGAHSSRNALLPILLLLDIKMPRVDGVEVLRQLKSNPQTALVPIIMLTTTDDPREIKRCYELGCSVYITKPVDYQAFVEAINRLGLFLKSCAFPTRIRQIREDRGSAMESQSRATILLVEDDPGVARLRTASAGAGGVCRDHRRDGQRESGSLGNSFGASSRHASGACHGS